MKFFCAFGAVLGLVLIMESKAALPDCSNTVGDSGFKGFEFSKITSPENVTPKVTEKIVKIPRTSTRIEFKFKYDVGSSLHGPTSYTFVMKMVAQGKVYLFGFPITSDYTIQCPSDVPCTITSIPCKELVEKIDPGAVASMCENSEGSSALLTFKVGEYGPYYPEIKTPDFTLPTNIVDGKVRIEIRIFDFATNAQKSCFWQDILLANA